MRAVGAEQAIGALRAQSSQQEALISTYFAAVDAAEDKVAKVRAAGVEAVTKAKAAADTKATADARVVQAQQDAE